MAATYPSGVKSFTTKTSSDTNASAHINDLQDEVVAVETALETALDLGGTLDVAGAATFDSTIAQTVTTITSTGNQDDLAHGNAGSLRCNNASLLTIRSLAAGVAGQRLWIYAMNAQVDIQDQISANGTATCRIITGATFTISLANSLGRALLEYDATTQRWRVLHHDQGGWITPTFAAGDYTASSGSWTVDAGDVTNCKYWLKDRTLHVQLTVVTTDVSATPTTLRRVLPGGFTAGTNTQHFIRAVDAGGTAVAGLASVNSQTINFSATVAGAGWSTTASDNTSVEAVMTVPL